MKTSLPLLLLAILLAEFCSAGGLVVTVGATGTFHSIQQALAQSKPGDTLLVDGGTYAEKNIVIKQPVVLIGKNSPVLDGEKQFEIFSVFADAVTIEGFHFKNSGYSDMTEVAAIKVYTSSQVSVKNCFFENTVFGIYFQEAKNGVISGNRFLTSSTDEIKSGNGIHCWRSDSLRIENNTIEGHRDGIYFEFVTHSAIRNNLSRGNLRYGLHFMFSHHNEYKGNTFSNNGAGVAVMYSNNVTMTGNVFADNRGSAAYGILMKEISDSRATGNFFRNNTTGIYLEGTNRVVLKRNEFMQNGYAIKMQANCNNNSVEENNFLANTFDITTNGSLVLNTLERNYWDQYAGYDLNRDGTGDVAYHPISLYSMVIEQVPEALMLLHSFMVALLDQMEKVMPSITPPNFADPLPKMKPFPL
jgi:nitrous oxidase accessory protein